MDHSILNDETYENFSRHIHGQVSEDRTPLNASVEVTMRCNLRCQHCYIPLSQRAASHPDELSLEEFRRIFSEFMDAGVFWLLLTGGEPLLRRDFLDIYDDAKQKGFIITLFTSGTLLNERIADHLAEYRPFAIEISLYGATEETYERITGVKGSFNRCMQGIKLINERDLPLKLKSPLMTLNAHELDSMIQFSESIGANFSFDPVINAGLDGDITQTRFRLSPEAIVEFEQHDERRAKTWPEKIASYEGKEINVPYMYTCGAGRKGFHMDAFGRLSMCISARPPSYDLRAGSFQEAWEEFFPKIINQEYHPDFKCVHCPLRMVCSQCPAMGLAEMGNTEVAVPFLCQLAHLRYEAFTK